MAANKFFLQFNASPTFIVGYFLYVVCVILKLLVKFAVECVILLMQLFRFVFRRLDFLSGLDNASIRMLPRKNMCIDSRYKRAILTDDLETLGVESGLLLLTKKNLVYCRRNAKDGSSQSMERCSIKRTNTRLSTLDSYFGVRVCVG